MQALQRLIPLVILPFWSGCGTSDPTLGTVEGTVTWNGTLLESGEIIFRDPEGQVSSAGGKIQQGRYAFVSSPTSMRVEILSYREVPGKFDEPSPGVKIPWVEQYLPARYNNASELTADIQSGYNQIDFELVE